MSERLLLIVVNDSDFFISHRLPIAIAAQRSGYHVAVASSTGNSVEKIKEHGFDWYEIPLTRSGMNISGELRLFASLIFLFWRLKPSIVHLVTIKPVLYGGLASRISPVGSVVAAVSGLGYVFMGSDTRSKYTRKIVEMIYRIALVGKKVVVIFQNPDDCKYISSLAKLKDNQVSLIKGSGVNLEDYPFTIEPIGAVVVTMASRLLRDKGVLEFVDAARILKSKGVDVRFWLIGDVDLRNPSSVSKNLMNIWREEGLVELFGCRTDIAEIFSRSNLIVLPSYREGLPKVLAEAAACGRAVITTDVPGCRDAIVNQVTGVLVPPKNSFELARAIEQLAFDSKLRIKMGLAGRIFAEKEFSIVNVVNRHLEIYKSLID